jgi:peptidyl-prolyl cis-trans isomerase SurA
MQNIIKILYILLFFCLNINSVHGLTNNIIVKINNDIITTYELKNKLTTSLILSDQQVNQENIDNNKRQALSYLINIKLKKIELNKYNFKIDKVDINNQLLFLSSNNIENFKNKFKEFDLNYDLFLNELKIETAWKELMFTIYNKKVKITQDEIDKQVINYVKNNSDITEYQIAEIEFFIEENSEIKNKLTFIKNQIDEFGFENTASKYSISSSSSNKGNIGWINEESLNVQTGNVIKKMNIGEVSEPIRNLDSITFFKLLNKKTSKISNLDTKKLREKLMRQKENELFVLYSASHLSKIKNNALIEYK